MKKIFDENITEEGIHAINALAECNRELLVNIIKEEGDESSEADIRKLTLSYILFLSGALSEAENHVQKYLDSSKKKLNERPEEMVSGILLLANIDSQSDEFEEFRLIREIIGVSLRHQPNSPEYLVKGLCELANERKTVGDSKGRFILLLMALSWCIRHPKTSTTYENHVPELKSAFESLGFVDSGWEWLIQASKSNIYDFVGLVSILLGRNLIPTGKKRLIAQGSPEERIESLIKDFPIRLEDRIAASSELNLELKFVCPICGSHNLRIFFIEPRYLHSTLRFIHIENSDFDRCDLIDGEPYDYEVDRSLEGWEFYCGGCGLEPEINLYEGNGDEATLAKWLLDNCPQEGIITKQL